MILYGPDGDHYPIVTMDKFVTTDATAAIDEFERVAKAIVDEKFTPTEWALRPGNEEYLKEDEQAWENETKRLNDFVATLRRDGVKPVSLVEDISCDHKYDVFINEIKMNQPISLRGITEEQE